MAHQIHASHRSHVYSDNHPETGADVVWKISSPDKNSIAHLENEFAIVDALAVDGIRKSVGKGLFQNREGFCYQHFEGKTIREVLQRSPFTLGEFLNLAVSISKVLKDIHRAGVFHFRLNSGNILCNTADNKVCIIDFSGARYTPTSESIDFEDLRDALNYVSPEQTGRLKQVIDVRSDLYSLGIVFYEMLKGSLPFDNIDSSIIIHAHLTVEPPLLSKADERIPEAVSNIIHRLLAKNPEDRYQTAHGLEQDLLFCKTRYDEGKDIKIFELGSQDKTNRLQLSEKIYGRENEISALLEGYDKSAGGTKQVFIIRGESGLGKTALIEAFKDLIVKRNNIFLYGRFDQFIQNSPHQAVIRALKELAVYILALSDDQHEQWRIVFQQAVGDIGGILIDLIPEFEWLLGAQPEVEELNGPQSKSRVNFLLQQIIEKVSQLHRPLVMAIDDIEWADPASWSNIKSIITNTNIDHLMLILGYRSNDENTTRVVQEEITELIGEWGDTNVLTLPNLSPDDVQQFMSDSIDTDDIGEFSKIVYAKTFGRPFFMHQFVDKAHVDGALHFNNENNKWRWNKTAITNLFISDNVAEFMSEKAGRLDSQLQKVLSYISCLGDHVRAEDISGIDNNLNGSAKELLLELVSENLIQTTDGVSFSFVHERVRQSGYALLSDESKSQAHYSYAEHLFGHRPEEPDQQYFFDVASHYRLGLSEMSDDRRTTILNLLLRAGVEARQSAAFDLSFEYLKSAIEVLGENDWEHNYSLALDIYVEAASAGMVSGQQTEADGMIDTILFRSTDILDRIKAHEIKISYLTENHHFAETVAHLLVVLNELGYPIKRNPNQLVVLREFALARVRLIGKNLEDVTNLPIMQHEKANAFMRLCVNATPSIFGYAPDILPVVFFREVKLSLKHGNSLYSPFAWCSYGFAISVFMDEITKGYEYGRMALRLVDKLDANPIRTKVIVTFYGFLSYWKDSFRVSIEPLREAYYLGRQSGDLLYACFALSFNTEMRLHCGEYLPDLLKVLADDVKEIKGLNQELVYWLTQIQYYYVLHLCEVKADPINLDSDDFNEKEFLRKLDEINDQATKFHLYNYKLTLAIIFNRYQEAYEFSVLASEFEDETTARQISYPSFLFLSAIALYNNKDLSTGSSEYKKARKNINKKLKLLKKFSDGAPQNFLNKYSILQAVVAEMKGDFTTAAALYNKAIELSREEKFIHEEAIAREHLAQLYESTGQKELAEVMINRAYEAYNQWGSSQKCLQLKEKYPHVLESQSATTKIEFSTLQTSFDLNTIVNAVQVLSGQSNLRALYESLLEIIIQNASATYAIAVLYEDGVMIPKAMGSSNSSTYFESVPDKVQDYFPQAVVNYVTRSKQHYVASNLSDEKGLAFDPYIQNKHPLSALCLPIISKQNYLGVIYLENNLAEGAFDKSRIEFFEAIGAQFAISLENVFLYREMEEKVEERTAELQKEKKKADDLLLNILPKETAEELKNYGRTTAKKFERASILFADIKGFTSVAESVNPEELVAELDHIFSAFDRICMVHGLEKIKTIGDAYMAVGGVPAQNKATTVNVAKAAIEMREFIIENAKLRNEQGLWAFEVLFGINVGPVVAGVVGINKFQFDIWGSAVNIASRMQTHSSAGEINISKTTHEEIKDDVPCTYRGEFEVRGVGMMDMYYVD